MKCDDDLDIPEITQEESDNLNINRLRNELIEIQRKEIKKLRKEIKNLKKELNKYIQKELFDNLPTC